MHKDYLNLLMKFYETVVNSQSHGQLLKHTLERYLNFQLQEQQRMGRQKERDLVENKSIRSGGSCPNSSTSNQINKLFYTNHLQTAVLFSYLLDLLLRKEVSTMHNLFTIITDKLRIYDNRMTTDDKKKYSYKVNKLFDQIQFIEQKNKIGGTIEWLFLEVFKQFQGQAVTTALLLSSTTDNIETKESIKNAEYDELLKVFGTRCYIFDYGQKQMRVLGVGDCKLYFGKREQSYFILSKKDFQRDFNNSQKGGNASVKSRQTQISPELKSLKRYSNSKCKQYFLSQMSKLRQSYQANTQLISQMFSFKDSVEDNRTREQIKLA